MLWLPEALAESFLLASGVKGVRASRPSELDVVGEAPRAAGGRRALRAGRRQLRMSLCIGGIERGTYKRKLIIGLAEAHG